MTKCRNRKSKFYVDVMNLNTEVTGSCILLVAKFPDETTSKVLIDCGLFQEREYEERNAIFPFDVSKINHVIITHNHVDHTGRIPLVYKVGYRNRIWMSNPTRELIELALQDSYKVLKSNATNRLNKKQENKSKKKNSLIYNEEDVEGALKLAYGCNFNETYCLEKNVSITFFKNGHLPGAVIGLLQFSFPGFENINIIFTGDYNNRNMFFNVPDLPNWVKKLNVTVIEECTYGNVSSSEVETVFEDNITKALLEEKTVIVPVFSLERAQEIMYTIKRLQDEEKIDINIPVSFDGKLGIKYTNIFLKNKLELDVKENFIPRNFQFIYTSAQREEVLNTREPKILIATSGMLSHGPIQEYLPIFVPDKNAVIHLTGYTAEGTVGRKLYECEQGDVVSIRGRQIKKNAEVKCTSEFSGHARSDVLLDFLRQFQNLKLVLINHGSCEAQQKYSRLVLDEIKPKDLGLLNAEYVFRINSYGLIKTIPTKF